MTQPTNAQLAASITSLLAAWNAREAEFRDWLAGSSAGGPNGDGRYPLTNASGQSFLIDCPAKLMDDVEGPTALARTAQLLAEQARDEADSFKLSAESARDVANAAKLATIDARDMAKVYRDDAAAFAAMLDAGKTDAQAARDVALEARDETLAARDLTVDARDATLAARAEAVQARDDAEAFATSINPSLLATKGEVEQMLADLVGSTPSTLDTLQEFAEALGNDPNFATTITNQLAGKAPLIHTHAISDILGLQTALDGKQPVGSYLNASAFTWTNLGGKPSAFPPSPHRHAWGELDGVPTSFTPTPHGHAIGDVVGLQAALDAKQPAGSYAQATHNHDARYVQLESVGADPITSRVQSGFYQSDSATVSEGWPVDTGGWQHLISCTHSNNSNYFAMQIAGSFYDQEFYGRKTAGNGANPWVRFWHSGNFDPASKAAASHTHDDRYPSINRIDTLFNNSGNSHGSYQDANAVPLTPGVHYLQGYVNGPGTGAGQFYLLNMGLGAEYTFGSYGVQLAIPRRDAAGGGTDTYLTLRYREGGAWTAWDKIKAGYADNAAALGGWLANVGGAANSIAARDGNGDSWFRYLWASYHNQSSPNAENGTVSQVMVTNGVDGFFRKASIEHFSAAVAMQSVQPTGLWQFNSNSLGAGTQNWVNPPLQAYASNGGPAVMSFHRAGLYAVSVGLDTDNVFKIGGWSMGANRLTLDSGGTLSVAGNINGTDVHADRKDNTGAIYLGGSGSIYLYYDGQQYHMPNAPLRNQGEPVARVIGAATGGGRIFKSSTQPSGMVEGDIWLKPI